METTTLKDIEPLKKIFDLYENNIREQIKLGSESDLFKLINELSKTEFNPENSKPLQVFSFPQFANLLDEKSRNFYLNKTESTVYEYREAKKTQAVLVNYISLEAKIEGKDDIDLCLRRLSKLFTYLVNRGLCIATLGDVIAIPYTHKDKRNIVCFGLWIALKKYREDRNNHPFKQFNELIGFDVFTNEGDTIKDFDWTQLDRIS